MVSWIWTEYLRYTFCNQKVIICHSNKHIFLSICQNNNMEALQAVDMSFDQQEKI